MDKVISQGGGEAKKNIFEIADRASVFWDRVQEGGEFSLEDSGGIHFRGTVVAADSHPGFVWVRPVYPKGSPVPIRKENLLRSPEGKAMIQEILAPENLSEKEMEQVMDRLAE